MDLGKLIIRVEIITKGTLSTENPTVTMDYLLWQTVGIFVGVFEPARLMELVEHTLRISFMKVNGGKISRMVEECRKMRS